MLEIEHRYRTDVGVLLEVGHPALQEGRAVRDRLAVADDAELTSWSGHSDWTLSFSARAAGRAGSADGPFRRRLSDKKPTSRFSLDRTRLTITTSFSRPWNAASSSEVGAMGPGDEPSTVPISISGCRGRRYDASRATWAW